MALRGKPPTSACKVPQIGVRSPLGLTGPALPELPEKSAWCLHAEHAELQTGVLPPRGSSRGSASSLSSRRVTELLDDFRRL